MKKKTSMMKNILVELSFLWNLCFFSFDSDHESLSPYTHSPSLEVTPYCCKQSKCSIKVEKGGKSIHPPQCLPGNIDPGKPRWVKRMLAYPFISLPKQCLIHSWISSPFPFYLALSFFELFSTRLFPWVTNAGDFQPPLSPIYSLKYFAEKELKSLKDRNPPYTRSRSRISLKAKRLYRA